MLRKTGLTPITHGRGWLAALFSLTLLHTAVAQAERRYAEAPSDPRSANPAHEQPTARSKSLPVSFNGFTSVQVNVDGAGLNITGDAANEPSMAVDPTNPQRIVIGFRWFDDVGSNFRQAGYAYSHDGGLTWTHPGTFDPGFFRSDPILDVDSSGRFYYQSISVNTQGFNGLFHYPLDLWRSDDGGVTWSPQAPSTFGGDRQTMAIDRTGGPGDGNIYMTWGLSLDLCRPCVGPECCGEPGAGTCLFNETLACTNTTCCDIGYFNRSTDGGATFGPRLLTRPAVPFSSPFAGTISVGPEGRVYSSDRNSLSVRISDDAADPMNTPTFVSRTVPMSGSDASVSAANTSGDSGGLEVDTDHSSGPRRGWVYALTARKPVGGDNADLEFVRSADGGETWSTPVIVADDGSADALQWFGSLSVAPNGRLDAVWNDTRDCPSLDQSQLMYAYSYNGGETWSPHIAVGPCWNSKTGQPGGTQEFPLLPSSDPKIGDYIWSISDAEGAAVAYPATYNNEQDVYFVRVFPDCNGNQISDVADIAAATAVDVNSNQVPDSCESDFTNPAGSVSHDPCTAFVTLDGVDTGSGVVETMISPFSDFSGAQWQPFNGTLALSSLACSSAQTFHLKVRDGACRESSPMTITVSFP